MTNVFLDEFLKRYELTQDDILAEIESAFGEQIALMATGSVVQGFANSDSDLDVVVCVESDRVSDFPVLAFRNGARIDVSFYSYTKFREQARSLGAEWPPHSTPMTRDAYVTRATAIAKVTRCALSAPLMITSRWNELAPYLDAARLQSATVAWWRVESFRRRVTSSWLVHAKPLLAAQKLCDAVFAALELRSARAGYWYFEQKWLPEKLKLADDTPGLVAFRKALELPVRAEEVEVYFEALRETLDQLLDGDEGDRLAVHLSLAPGVCLREMGRLTQVSRWNMRAIEVAGLTLDDSEVIAEVPLDTTPSVQLLELASADLLWLGVGRKSNVRDS